MIKAYIEIEADLEDEQFLLEEPYSVQIFIDQRTFNVTDIRPVE